MLGYDVVRVGNEVRIPSDTDIIHFATKEQRVLVTHDQDFGELVFKKGNRAPFGVVLFRYEPPHPEEVAKRLVMMLRSGLYQFKGSFTTVDENKVRQRPC